MAVALPRPNARKPWTPEETEELRRLALGGEPARAIAARLGRSLASVSSRAETIGVGLGKGAAERSTGREKARRRGAEGRTPG